MIKNSFDSAYEMRVLAIMNRFLLAQVKSDSTQRVIAILSCVKSMRAVDMSRVFYALRKSSDVSVAFKTSFCSIRVAQITRALCVQNSDKSYTLASRDIIAARQVAQVKRVHDMLTSEAIHSNKAYAEYYAHVSCERRVALNAYANEANARLLRFVCTI